MGGKERCVTLQVSGKGLMWDGEEGVTKREIKMSLSSRRAMCV